ncbi:cytochrome B [Limnohabitans sp. T6-5]|uniref:cytochrome b n=1 Tax=Limnohabitans sp. T6-5 TaxID=1100724 RepID=UPI000D33D62A|nr:cytochrome b/b6 domain-containing protein [Limnohabitans sp. T6-5]PUE11564.1 cytochrome B [Limnohabitans sp. T6-5]
MNTPRTHYDTFSRALHWLTAIVVIAAFILGPEHFGREMRQGLDPATRWDIVVHESLGVLVVVLTLLRLLWVAVRPSKPQFEMSKWMQLTAKSTHGLLWLMLLAVPVSAFLALGSEGHPLTLLGGIRVNEMPFIAQSPLADLADWGDVHGLLGDMILWLSGLHAVAAIFHHVLLKDGVLISMLPSRR